MCFVADLIRIKRRAQLAQLVEQRTENPRVSGSIPELGTVYHEPYVIIWFVVFLDSSTTIL